MWLLVARAAGPMERGACQSSTVGAGLRAACLFVRFAGACSLGALRYCNIPYNPSDGDCPTTKETLPVPDLCRKESTKLERARKGGYMKDDFKANAIKFLIDRKFPNHNLLRVPVTLSNVHRGLLSQTEREEKLREIDAYRENLLSQSAEALQSLYKQERLKYEEEHRDRAAQEEAKRFFNRPTARADFEYWSKAAYWELDEAVALLFGKAPDIVTWDNIAAYVRTSRFAREYSRLRDLVLRAKKSYQLDDPVVPDVFLAWAEGIGYQIPKELVAEVEKRGVMVGWENRYLKQREEYDKLEKENSALKQRVGQLDADRQKARALLQSDYWLELEERAVRAVSDFPSWSATQRKIQKTGNLQDWLTKTIGADNREAEILKKILSDIFQELR